MIRTGASSFGITAIPNRIVSGPFDTIVIGTGALPTISAGTTQTTAIGTGALAAMDGSGNSGSSLAMGWHAGNSAIRSRADVFLGHKTGEYALYSNSNVFVGGFAGVGGHANTPYLPRLGADLSGNPVVLAGIQNVGIGEACLIAIHGTSAGNVYMGFNAGYGLGDGSNNNIGIGAGAGLSLGGTPASMATNALAASNSVMIGVNAYRFGQGGNNVVIGPNAGAGLYMLTKVATGSGSQNAAGQAVVAIQAASSSGGFDYVGVGSINVGDTFYSGSSEVNCTVLSKTGSDAGTITLSDNLFSALSNDNVCFVIDSPNTGMFSTLVGFAAGASIQGTNSAQAFGSNALGSLTTGTLATGIGDSAGFGVTIATRFTGVGYQAGEYVSEGDDNTFLGALAGKGVVGSKITGANNTGLGSQAGKALITTAHDNTFIGFQSGSAATTGFNLIAIGSTAMSTATTASNSIIIGNALALTAVGATYELNIARLIYGVNIYGQSGSKVGIGTDNSAPDGVLDVAGEILADTYIRAYTGTSIPAGGTAGQGFRFFSATNFGIFAGSGAPSLAAAKGSLYLRSDGSGVNDRAYINTDGSTTWTAIVTLA